MRHGRMAAETVRLLVARGAALEPLPCGLPVLQKPDRLCAMRGPSAVPRDHTTQPVLLVTRSAERFRVVAGCA